MSVGLCLIAMSAANVVCIRHMWRARKLQWSKRRFRLVAIHYAMLNIQVRALDAPDCPYQVLHVVRQKGLAAATFRSCRRLLYLT